MVLSPHWLSRRILVPVSTAAVLLLAVIVSLFVMLIRQESYRELENGLQSAREYWAVDQRHHITKLEGVLAALARNPTLVATLAAGDRAALQRETADIYQEMEAVHGFDRLGFLDSQGRVLLRQHEEAAHGDLMDTPAVQVAMREGRLAAGLVVGRFGMALQAVMPVMYEGRVAGYVTVGESLDHVLEHMDELFHLRHLVVLDKRYLNQRNLQEVFAGGSNWDALSNHAILFNSLQELPVKLLALLQEERLDTLGRGRIIECKGCYLFSGTLPLIDQQGEKFGHVILLRDVTAARTSLVNTILVIVVITLLTAGLLLWLLYLTSSRAETAYGALHLAVEEGRRAWEDAFDAIRAPIFLHDHEFRVVRANRAYAALAGMDFSEVIGRPYWEVFPRGEGPLPKCGAALQGAIDLETGEEQEEEIRLADGRFFSSRAFYTTHPDGSFQYSVHVLEDMTARQRMLEQVQQSEARLAEAQRLARLGNWDWDIKGGTTVWSEEMYRIFGVSAEEWPMSFEAFMAAVCEADRARVQASLDAALAGGESHDMKFCLRRPEGEELIIHGIGSVIFDETGQPLRMAGTAQDVTAQAALEMELQRENRIRQIVSTSNQALIQAHGEQQLLDTICQIITRQAEYPFVWVGFREEDATHSLRPVAVAGLGQDEVDMLPNTWADTAEGQSPSAQAIRSGLRVFVTDVVQEGVCESCRRLAARLGYGSLLALPLKDGDATFGALTIAAAEPGAFNDSEMALLEGLAGDMAYGIVALRADALRRAAEEERQRVLLKLETSLDQTVMVMARSMEVRDPYTAGHQERVAELATAIAEEMDLPQDQVESIRIAATVHDIGKINIPAEILSRPGRLSPIEFELIKSHSAVGYDLLKGIDFPWPVAQMVRQHHERLDGSGYPDGISGDEIMLEARIIAVADVMEAMVSHRPYRAGLPLEQALGEIETHQGTHYDPQVVKACVRLFREGGFAWSASSWG
jgi:PAS domain S-box-containing protein/putative nucleotidyltransferase with HDIG domain